MNQSHQFSEKYLRSIWWLPAIAVVTALITNAIMQRALQRLESQIEQSQLVQSQFHHLEEACFQLIRSSQQDCYEVLRTPLIPKAKPAWLDRNFEEEFSLASIEPSQSSSWATELSDAQHRLANLYHRASLWANEWSELDQQSLTLRRQMQIHLRELQQCLRLATDQAHQEWNSAIHVNNLPHSPTPLPPSLSPQELSTQELSTQELSTQELSTQELSTQSLQQRAQHVTYWYFLKSHIDELGYYLLKLQSFEDQFKFEDCKRQHVGPILYQIAQELHQSPDPLLGAPMLRELDQIALAVVGPNTDWKRDPSQLRCEENALFSCMSRKFALADRNRQLELESFQLAKDVHRQLDSMRTAMSAYQDRFQHATHDLVRQTQFRISAVSIPALTLLIFLSIGLPRVIRRQFVALQAAFQKIIQQQSLLQQEKERFSHAVVNANLGAWEYDISNQQVWMSDQGQTMLGLTNQADPIPIDAWIHRIHSDDRATFRQSLDATAQGLAAEWKVSVRVPCEPNGTRWINTLGRVSLRDSHGTPLRLSGIQIDETERRELENHLNRSTRLESIGQLAAGVAHEINSPTQFVMLHVSYLQQASSDLLKLVQSFVSYPEWNLAQRQQALHDADWEFLQTEIPMSASHSLDGLARITKIVKSLKEYAHMSNERTHSNISEIIQSAIDVSQCEWRHHAHVQFQQADQELIAEVDAGEMRQLLLNLIVNATHAIQDRTDLPKNMGTIVVEMEDLVTDFEIRIRDNGCGIPPDVQKRIFEPFFTTKPIGKGTGQGLAIAHRIVHNHEGIIQVQTSQGVGTTFIIRMPKQARTALSPNQNQPSSHDALQTA